MLDRTNVGISPLISTPMTASYQVPAPATTSYTQQAYPVTTYGQNVTQQTTSYVPETTTYTQEALTSFAPQITTPDQVLSSFVPETGVQTTAPQTSLQASIVPNVVLSQQQQAPPQAQPATTAPVMDEDFQRGRPIYDEFSEDRYRGFRLAGK